MQDYSINELIEKMESNQEFYENKLKEQFNVDKLFSEPLDNSSLLN